MIDRPTMIALKPIGFVRSPVTEPRGCGWSRVVAVIELDTHIFKEEAVAGLDQFSHIEVIFHLHLVAGDVIETGARRPRNRGDLPLVGILAQRTKRQPNSLGLSCCRLLAVTGLNLTVEGLDALDGTPVLDVKPYFLEFGPRGEVKQPPWVREMLGGYMEG
jgi:tRNA-Thr(GGU) m(6)t(6)A37 methyltransferase TsaA